MCIKRNRVPGVYRVYISLLFLLFLFVLFTPGSAQGFGKPGGSRSLDTILKDLFDFKGDHDGSGYLSIFIKKVENARNPKYDLDDWLLRTSVKRIEEFLVELKSHKQDLITRRSRSLDKDVIKQYERMLIQINRFIGEFERLCSYAEKEETLRQGINNVNSVIKGLGKLDLVRSEFPPNDGCFDCDRFWRTFEWVADYQTTRETLGYSTLGQLLDEVDRLADKKETICNMLSRLKAIDLNRIDRDFKYYSWTMTRKSINKILSILEDNTVRRICRIY